MASINYNTVAGPFANQILTEASLGPSIVGALVNLILLGFVLTYAKDYLESTYFERDSLAVKATVFSVLSLAICQSSFEFWLVYRYGCTQDRGVVALFTKTIIDNLDTLFVGLEGGIVQTFLAIRAGRLISSQRWRLGFLAVTFSAIFVGVLGSVTYVIISLMERSGTAARALPLTVDNSTLMWLAGASISDISITSCLCFTLSKKLDGFRSSTDSMLKELIKVAVQSASYTAVCATIPLILNLSVNEYTLAGASSSAFPIPLSSLYAISLLMTLISRSKVSAIRDGQTVIKSNFGVTSAGSYNNHTSIPLRVRARPALDISYKTQTHTVTEDRDGEIVEF